MKKIMLLLLIAVGLSSCSRVISTDYEELSSGFVTHIDEEQCEIEIQTFADRQSFRWKVSQIKDGLSWRLFKGYTEDISVGDTVFVYKNRGGVFASKVSVAEAQRINQTLISYFWRDFFQVSRLSFLTALMLLMVISYYISKERKNGYMMAVFSLFMAICIFLPGKTLQLTMLGFVNQLGDEVVIDNAFQYKTANEKISEDVLKDAFSDEEVKVSDFVYVYKYEFFGSPMAYFVSKQRLNEHTLTVQQVYPEIFLRVCLLEAVLMLVALACVFPFRKKISLLKFD